MAPFTEADFDYLAKQHRRMTPGEIGKDLRARGFTPAPFDETEPRTYLPESALGRDYFDEA